MTTINLTQLDSLGLDWVEDQQGLVRPMSDDYRAALSSAYTRHSREESLLPPESPLSLKGEWKSANSNLSNHLYDAPRAQFNDINQVANPECPTRHAAIATKIGEKYITSPTTVCEIGAGMGGVCYNIMRSSPFSVKYVLFDIPSVLHISSTYLLKFLNRDVDVYLYTEEDEELTVTALKQIIKSHDLILLPHYVIDRLPKGAFDIFINTGSACEMPTETCEYYFNVIKKTAKEHTTLFMEYRKKELLRGPGIESFAPLKHEIDVDPIAAKYFKETSRCDARGHGNTYWEVIYEN